MRARNSGSFLHSFQLVIGVSLFLLASTVSVNAQKTPPILKNDESSAFNKEKIRTLQGLANGANAEEAKLARNKLIAIAVEQTDAAFNDFRRNSRKRSALLQFLFDFLEIGASSAISIVNGERPKALIGEGLSLFQGSRSAFNKDFRFLERQILFNKMVAKRSEKLTAIYNRFSDDVLKYPWEQARSDLRNYFYAGTIDEALNELSIDTGNQAQSSQIELAQAKKRAGIQGAPSEIQIKVARENFTTVKDVLRSSGEAVRQADAQIIAETSKAPPDQAKIKQLQDSKLAGLRAVYAVIKTDNKLSPLLLTIPEEFPEEKPELQALLKKLNEKPETATLDDFSTVLTRLNGVIVKNLGDDPTLSDQLRKILANFKP